MFSGYRSVYRDLESQIFLATDSAELRSALRAEKDHLFAYAHEVTAETYLSPERVVPRWVKLFTLFFRYYF